MLSRLRFASAVGAALFALCCLTAIAAAQSGSWEPAPAASDAVIGPAAGSQTDPDIERGGDIFLAVWSDERTTVPGDASEYASQRDVYAVRLDSNGEPIESVPIVLSDDIADQYGARASWNGSNWLVTWTSQTPDPEHPYYPRGIEAVRVSPAGEILDASPFLVYPSPVGSVKYLVTGSDGTDWVVFLSETVQSGMNTDTYLKGARVSPSGMTLGAPVTMFSPSCCYFFPLGTDVAYAGGQYLLAFECIPSSYVNDAICGMRFTQSLTKVDTYPFQIAGTSGVFREPRVATDGTDFMVGWYHYTSYPPASVTPYCARVTAGGVSLDPDGIDLAAGTGFGADRLPRVAWDGTNWLAVWPDNLGARTARVTPGGTLLDPGGVSFPGLGANALAEVPGGVRVIWSDSDAGGAQPEDVHTAHISGALSAGPEVTASLGAPAHVRADIAQGDDEAMLVFRSDVSGTRSIMAQAASLYEEPGRAEPTLVASGPLLNDPEIAWNGSLYLVVWSDEGSDEILGTRVLQDGTVLDDPPISVMDGLDADVAAVGEDFLVVATDGSLTSRRPYGVRIQGSDGAVLDATPILLGNSYARGARVAGMVARWLVTWERRPSYDAETADVWSAFVDTDGTTPGEFGVATNQVTSDYHYAPAIASSPGIALVLWEDTRTYPGDDWNVYGRRVRIDGVVLDDPDGFGVATGPADERNASVGWNGTVFQAAFEVTEQVGWFDHTVPDVHGTRVDVNGAIVEPPNFAIESGEGAEVQPAVTGGGSESLVVVSAFVEGDPYAAYRLVLHPLGDGSTGIVDQDPEEARLLLAGAFPNPTDSSATVRFSLPERARVTVVIHDVAGRVVRRLMDGEMPEGDGEVVWDGRDDSGHDVASGLYFYRVESWRQGRTGKLALLR
jgi:hypothetical protein